MREGMGWTSEELAEIHRREWADLTGGPMQISSQRSAFAKSEVVSLIAEKNAVTDNMAGVHAAIVSRLLTLLYRLGIEENVLFSGGVGKNIGTCHPPHGKTVCAWPVNVKVTSPNPVTFCVA